MSEDAPKYFPVYPAASGPPSADHKQAGPMTKMLNKMIGPKLKPKLLGRAKGIKSDQAVHIKHKRVKFY